MYETYLTVPFILRAWTVGNLLAALAAWAVM